MRKLIPLLILVLCFSCKVDYHQTDDSATTQRKTYVEVEAVKTQTIPIPIRAIGRLGSDQEVKLSFKIGGIIAALEVDEGDYVKKGKLLGAMRTNEIDAQVLKAERAVQKATRDLERTQRMFADSVATSENVDDIKTLLEVSKADLEIATFNQQYSRIISPVSGRVIRRMAQPNELVGPGQPIFLIASSVGNSYVMKVALSDKDVSRIKYGSAAKIRFDAFPNEHFEGKVTTLSESADPRTGTFEVEISINARNKRLRNGYIGQAEITPPASEPYLEIPIQSIVEGDKKEVSIFVPVEADTIAKEVKVTPFHITNRSVFVLLDKEQSIDKVITKGAAYLLDGDRIYQKE